MYYVLSLEKELEKLCQTPWNKNKGLLWRCLVGMTGKRHFCQAPRWGSHTLHTRYWERLTYKVLKQSWFVWSRKFNDKLSFKKGSRQKMPLVHLLLSSSKRMNYIFLSADTYPEFLVSFQLPLDLTATIHLPSCRAKQFRALTRFGRWCLPMLVYPCGNGVNGVGVIQV